MSVDEHTRHVLHQDLERALGSASAAALMSYLPPVGWADVATKHDLDVLRAATRSDLELHAAQFRAELHEVRGELRAELHGLRGDLRAELHDGLASLQRTMFFQMLGVMATLTSLTWVAARFG